MMMMAVFPACEDFEGRLDDSFAACAFFLFLERDQIAHTSSTVLGQDQSSVVQRAEIEVSVFHDGRVACKHVSLISSQTMPGQHSQPIPTSLGQGRMHV